MSGATAVTGQRSGMMDAVVIGAGVGGLYQLHRLLELGLEAELLEAAAGLGGTWFENRYPGCRFDSESYSYGYSFSPEILDTWHWKELFSPQSENLRYLRFAADKLGLGPHMRFNAKVVAAHYDEVETCWRLRLADGEDMRCRFLVTALGPLSTPTVPKIDGIERFAGQAFHSARWPHDGVELRGRRVAVVGAGSSAVQIVSTIASQVEELFAVQRRPNWCVPLNNSPISADEMDRIRARYDEIFEKCADSPGGFIHQPDRRGFYTLSAAERRAYWDELYDEPGFGIWLDNFREIFTDDAANAEFSAYIAERIRQRVRDPEIADLLIPQDHGFGVQRVPLETGYYEVFNRDNVKLVSLKDNPIVGADEGGLVLAQGRIDVDIIVFATGFDGFVGGYNAIDIRGRGGRQLRRDWAEGPATALGLLVHGYPNLAMVGGPQSGSSATNFPRGLELAVDWISTLIQEVTDRSAQRFEATEELQLWWQGEVSRSSAKLLTQNSRSWITGYNSNIAGRENGFARPVVYGGGLPKYRSLIAKVAADGYPGIDVVQAQLARP